MRRTVLLIVIICFVLSCDRYPDPSVKASVDYSFYYQTTPGQKLLAGELVSDSIIFIVRNNVDPAKDSIRVDFEVVEGGGNITIQSTYTDKNGIATTGWTLGTASSEQKLRAKTYDLSGKYLASTDLIEYGFRTDEWNSFNGTPEADLIDIIADTIGKVTFMIANSNLYKQADKYYIWNEVTDPAFNSPTTINIDINGVFYIGTYTGAILKSTDDGKSWHTCTNPFTDSPYITYISISNDNYIWVFASGHNPIFSKDGGSTWNNSGSELSLHGGWGDFFRLKDGSLLFHGSYVNSLYRSFDNGLTWIKVETPGYSLKLYVNDKDEIFIWTEENGITVYESTDSCVTFNKVYSIYPAWPNMDNSLAKWGNYYYVLIQGWGILRSADLINYEEYWFNKSLSKLFIDHNGDLIAKDQSSNTVYYRKNSGK